jgi:hypothetical protein
VDQKFLPHLLLIPAVSFSVLFNFVFWILFILNNLDEKNQLVLMDMQCKIKVQYM